MVIKHFSEQKERARNLCNRRELLLFIGGVSTEIMN